MINSVEAIAVARASAEAKNWSWGEPVSCELRPGWFGSNGRYEIWTNAGMLGTKARFMIDAETGAVLQEGYIPR